MLTGPQLFTAPTPPATAVVKNRASVTPKMTARSRLAPALAPLFPGPAAGGSSVLGPTLRFDDEVILALPSSISPANGLNDAPTYKFIRDSVAEGWVEPTIGRQ